MKEKILLQRVIWQTSYVVPQAYLIDIPLPPNTPPATVAKNDYLNPLASESIRKAYAAGVNVAYGTDSGVSPHGTNAEEAVLMVEAGMTEMEVLVAATINAADLIDMSDSIGTIEAGKFADIIAVDRSPLESIEELLDVDFVMKGGKVYKN